LLKRLLDVWLICCCASVYGVLFLAVERQQQPKHRHPCRCSKRVDNGVVLIGRPMPPAGIHAFATSVIVGVASSLVVSSFVASLRPLELPDIIPTLDTRAAVSLYYHI
jgi:hypothetical protein